MLTLSFGFQKPETGDLGGVVFPALEANIQQLNDHTHDGANSSKLTSGALSPLSEDVAAGAWGASIGNGLYKQTITLPAALSFDSTGFDVRLLSTGHVVHPTIEKVSATQYDIFTNDNTEGFKVLYI